MKSNLPEHLEEVRLKAARAIDPIRPLDEYGENLKNSLFSPQRTEAGRQLPPYYLVYFLLVDLLGFRNLGQFEKLAWSVPVEYNGNAYVIEHRKMGLGVFVDNPHAHENEVRDLVNKIHKATKASQPYFEWRADNAVSKSELNVTNHTDPLYQRFEYFLGEYDKLVNAFQKEVKRRRSLSFEERMAERTKMFDEPYSLTERIAWMAITVIESFFSFTEHVFIHLSILLGKITTGKQVTALAEADWPQKYKAVFDIDDPEAKRFYDDLVEIRRQHRNFVAHGAFGKRGEAFTFHSGAGATPVLLPHMRGSKKFALDGPLTVEDPEAIGVIVSFVEYLWSGPREPARLYLQRTTLPVILTMASDGTYARAMGSCEDMDHFVNYLVNQWERSLNMDW